MRARPFVFLHFFPVRLSPSPPLKSSTSQGFRTDLFAIHSGNVTCPAKHSFSDGNQHVHSALFDPPMTRPVPHSPPLVHFHPWWLFHSNHVKPSCAVSTASVSLVSLFALHCWAAADLDAVLTISESYTACCPSWALTLLLQALMHTRSHLSLCIVRTVADAFFLVSHRLFSELVVFWMR